MSIKEVFNNSEGNLKSLQEELHFKIGEQYDLNEFNLKSLKSTFENDLEYDVYEYIKDGFDALFGVKFSKNVILQYNADILYKVIYEFESSQYDYLYSKISSYILEEISVELIKDENCCQIVQKKRKKAHF